MECRPPRREDERRVKRLLEELFPGLQACSYDDNSRPGMYDLELRWPDGRIEAMEVTSAASQEVSAITAAAHDLRRPRFMVKAVKVRYRWSIELAVQQHFKQVRPQLAELACHLDERLAEREAEPTFDLLRDQMEYQSETVEALRALGVVSAIALPADPDPFIYLLAPGPPGARRVRADASESAQRRDRDRGQRQRQCQQARALRPKRAAPMGLGGRAPSGLASL
jgi:hypothetical protein